MTRRWISFSHSLINFPQARRDEMLSTKRFEAHLRGSVFEVKSYPMGVTINGKTNDWEGNLSFDRLYSNRVGRSCDNKMVWSSI